jgi:TolA-binding protein
MKKILVTVVLGVAVLAAAKDAARPLLGQAASPQPSASPAQPAQPAQAQAPASPAQAPVIKDPAEYNAYVGASQQKDPAAEISGLEAFLTQYPNSIMKPQALEILMALYQQTNSPKVMDTAQRVLAVNPDNVKALVV